ncbi:MAG: 3'(2'),5'-bisphosphate nucleotidase [Caedibacter sp. 37-49]|nr:MAG: 3'(2'),5'-bisphosphate nucleotidase [Caedibacter sp. 37-49]
MNAFPDYKQILEKIIKISYQAGKVILNIYNESFKVCFKNDSSPLTEADTQAHELIFKSLEALTPNIPIISEEKKNYQVNKELFWLVDPLDGTKEFIKKNGEFTVNIALIYKNLPLLGVIYLPVFNVVYAGIVNDTAFKILPNGERMLLSIPSNLNTKIIVLGSRRHGSTEEMKMFLTNFNDHEYIGIGSSLKFCKIADGEAHIYPRFGRTMEWDTAAGQAILMAAGGIVYTFEGQSLLYGKKNFENPYFISCASHNLFEKGIKK